MNSASTDARAETSSQPLPPARGPFVHQGGPLSSEELKEVLQALAIPFDLVQVQWRVTEYSDDGTRGLMLPYADPRANCYVSTSVRNAAGIAFRSGIFLRGDRGRFHNCCCEPNTRGLRSVPSAIIFITTKDSLACAAFKAFSLWPKSTAAQRPTMLAPQPWRWECANTGSCAGIWNALPNSVCGKLIPSFAEIMQVSHPYAALIRSGRRRPHPRHWQVLARLAGVQMEKL